MNKKAIALLSAAVFMSSAVWAASTTSYDEMKQIKKAQREAREARKASGGPQTESKWSQFWKKEGERSGLGQRGGAKSVVSKLNPMPFFKSQEEKYNARKAAGTGAPQAVR